MAAASGANAAMTTVRYGRTRVSQAAAWLSARLARRAGPAAPPSAAQAPAGGKAAGLLTGVLQYLTVVIAAFAPLAAAIYLLTTIAWTIAERRLFLRRIVPAASVPRPQTR